jgi:uncharacterized protein involved in exopolysaccharide biosynthesis
MADSLDLFDFLTRLRRRRNVWLAAALAGGLIGAGVSLLRPVRYVAETHLLVETPPDAVSVFTMMSPPYLDSLETYAVLAESATVRSRALASLSEAHRAAAHGVDADAPTLTRVIVVRAGASDPESALAFARAAAEQTLAMVNAVRPEAASHQERLLLVDPGVPPESPEDRNAAGNALAAAFFGLAAAVVYETVRYLAEHSGRDA